MMGGRRKERKEGRKLGRMEEIKDGRREGRNEAKTENLSIKGKKEEGRKERTTEGREKGKKGNVRRLEDRRKETGPFAIRDM